MLFVMMIRVSVSFMCAAQLTIRFRRMSIAECTGMWPPLHCNYALTLSPTRPLHQYNAHELTPWPIVVLSFRKGEGGGAGEARQSSKRRRGHVCQNRDRPPAREACRIADQAVQGSHGQLSTYTNVWLWTGNGALREKDYATTRSKRLPY